MKIFELMIVFYDFVCLFSQGLVFTIFFAAFNYTKYQTLTAIYKNMNFLNILLLVSAFQKYKK